MIPQEKIEQAAGVANYYKHFEESEAFKSGFYKGVRFAEEEMKQKPFDEDVTMYKKKLIAILKEFEQRDYKRGGTSIAPEMHDAISDKIYRELIKSSEPTFCTCRSDRYGYGFAKCYDCGRIKNFESSENVKKPLLYQILDICNEEYSGDEKISDIVKLINIEITP